MRTVWGYMLGPVCHLKPRLLKQIREYPYEEGSRHKQVALQQAGLLQTLMFGSEGAIDGSNLPYSYVSLPLKNPGEIAEKIRKEILLRLGKRVSVMIVDTDKTYSLRNFHFTPRPRPIRGIQSGGGFVTYVIGRVLRLRKRATPLAVAGCSLNAEQSLRIAEIANRSRGFGTGRTVWEMTEKFKVGFTDVSWEMLDGAKHKPIVLVRSNEENRDGRKSASPERLL
jgi:F420-0:gamma-glutamyl ligase-like protein